MHVCKSFPQSVNVDQQKNLTYTLKLKPHESPSSSPLSAFNSQTNENNQPAVSTRIFPIKISASSPFIFTAPPSNISPSPKDIKASPGKIDLNVKSPSDQASELLSKNKKVSRRSKPPAVQAGEWVPGSFQIISNGKFIYYINSATLLMFKVNPCFPEEILELKYCLDKEKIEYLSSFDELLLLFCSDDAKVDKTVIYAFDTNTEEARRLTVVDGPASGLVTFQDDDNRYMLQSTGALWTITRQLRDHFIDFSFLIKLWDFEFKLNGGVFYNGELFLHGNDPVNLNKTEPKYPEIFARIHIHGQSEKCSRFIPFIILKKGWIPKKD